MRSTERVAGDVGAGFPIAEVRADTPGVDHVLHLNNAGSSLPARPVLDTVIGHLRREAEIGGYEAAQEAEAEIDAVYASAADLVGADLHQIAMTDSATQAWNTAVHGYPFRAGDRVLTARAEYASNAIALMQLRDRHGIEIVLVEDDEHGRISLAHLEAELDRGAALVSLTHVPTGGGLVNPAEEVGRLCRSHDTFYVLDACQSAGQVPLDVAVLGCDVLSATGRKYLRAPRGTGFLYVSERALSVLEPPSLDLHSALWTGPDSYEVAPGATRFEQFEANVAARLGLGVACRYALGLGVERTWARIRGLAERLREGLGGIERVSVHDKGVVRGGTVTFTVDGETARQVSGRLRSAGINTSVTAQSSAVFDLPERGLDDVVRASVHYYNTESEVDRLIAEVADPSG